ncbi:MAG: hypothetical protein KF865_14100, partial [Bdellovibrionaceae bacterium]|nr:hypothetical protein [Pseudobdellovibrionaceae bacterium]
MRDHKIAGEEPQGFASQEHKPQNQPSAKSITKMSKTRVLSGKKRLCLNLRYSDTNKPFIDWHMSRKQFEQGLQPLEVIMLPSISLLAPLFASTLIWGQTTSSVLIDAKTKNVTIRNYMHAHTDDARTRAVIIRALLEADSIARLNPNYSSNKKMRTDLYRRFADRGRAEAALDKWSGGLVETGLRMTSAAAFGTTTLVAAPTVAGSITAAAGGVYMDTLITKHFEDKDVATRAQAGANLSVQEIISLNNYGDFYLKSNPDFKDVKSELDIGVFKTDPSSDPAVRTENTIHDLQDENSRISKSIKDVLSDNRVTREEYENLKRQFTLATGELRAEAAQALAILKRNQTDEAGQKKRAIERNNISGPFYAMAGIASLFKDESAARFFSNAGSLAGNLYDIKKLPLEIFKENPFMCLNLYLATANIALNLISGAQENAEFNAIMKQLEQIALQIEKLREEMHSRFDQLETKMDHYFYEASIDLTKMKASQENIRQAIYSASKEIANLRNFMQKGL